MTDRIPPLAGSWEATQILGVGRQRLHQLQQTAGFPDPVQRLKSGPIWTVEALEVFNATRPPDAKKPTAFCTCRMHKAGAERAMCPIHPLKGKS